MRKKVFKIFAEWQFEEEEKWLNEMADKGWKLVEVGFGTFTFEPCEPGEYTIRTQILEQSYKDKKSRDYISFIEETGAEFAGGFWVAVYFRKKRSEGEFELFSDNTSRIKHMNTIMTMLIAVAAANLISGVMNLALGGLTGLAMNWIMGLICMFFVIMLGGGAYKLYKKKKKLMADDGILEK